MPTLDDLLRETEDKDKKKGGLDALLRETEQPKAKGLDALLAETGEPIQPRPTLTPTPFTGTRAPQQFITQPPTPSDSNPPFPEPDDVFERIQNQAAESVRADMGTEPRYPSNLPPGAPPPSMSLQDMEMFRRAGAEAKRQVETGEIPKSQAIAAGVKPFTSVPRMYLMALTPASFTAGTGLVATGVAAGTGAAINVGVEFADRLMAEGRMPTKTETAIAGGLGAVVGPLAHPVARAPFGKVVKKIAGYFGTSPQQVNKTLTAVAKETGATRGAVADNLIQNATKEPEGAKYFAEYLDEAAKMGVADEAIPGPSAVDDTASVFQAPKPKGDIADIPVEPPSGMTPVVDETFIVRDIASGATEDTGKTFTRTLDTGTMDELTQTVKNVIAGIEDPLEQPLSKQVKMMHVVSKWLHDGRIQMPRLRPTLEKLGIDPVDYMRFEAEEFKRASTHAGRHLNFLSQLSKEYRKAYKGTPAEAVFDELAKKADKHPWYSTTNRWLKNLINFHRGSVVTQQATAARNSASAKFRATLEIFETALDDLQNGRPIGGSLKTAGGQTGTLIRRTGEEIADIFTFGKVWKGKGAKSGKFMELLEKDFPLQSVKLTETSVHEVNIANKWLKTVNYFNQAQEMHNRRIGYEMRLRTNLAKLGVTDFDNFDPKLIPEKDYVKAVEDAVDFALDMTFANEAKNPISKAFVKTFRDAYLLQPLLNEFPRFNFANAWQYMWEYSPGGFLRYLSPAARQAYRSGNTRGMSRAMIGTALTAAGYALRSSEYAGNEWYQLQYVDETTGKETIIDTRAMFPLPFYLFLGELIHNPKNLTWKDYIFISTGLNRVGGTGLMVADLIRDSGRSEQGWNRVKDFAGLWFGGFTVPFLGPKDIIGDIQQTINPNEVAGEAAYREQKENLLFGPLLTNIPGVGTLQDKGIIDVGLQQVATPFTGGETGQKQHPLLRQFTGITMQDRTPLQNEVQKHDLYGSFYSNTGIPKADNKLDEYRGIIIKNMGDPVIEPVKIGEMTVTPEMYNSLPPPAQRIILRKYAEEVRKRSMDMLEILDPVLYQKVKIRKMDKDEAELLGIDRNNPFNE